MRALVACAGCALCTIGRLFSLIFVYNKRTFTPNATLCLKVLAPFSALLFLSAANVWRQFLLFVLKIVFVYKFMLRNLICACFSGLRYVLRLPVLPGRQVMITTPCFQGVRWCWRLPTGGSPGSIEPRFPGAPLGTRSRGLKNPKILKIKMIFARKSTLFGVWI